MSWLADHLCRINIFYFLIVIYHFVKHRQISHWLICFPMANLALCNILRNSASVHVRPKNFFKKSRWVNSCSIMGWIFISTQKVVTFHKKNFGSDFDLLKNFVQYAKICRNIYEHYRLMISCQTLLLLCTKFGLFLALLAHWYQVWLHFKIHNVNLIWKKLDNRFFKWEIVCINFYQTNREQTIGILRTVL